MTSLALPLIIFSAILHASWNLLAKRAKTTGAILVFLFAVVETVVYFPLVILTVQQIWLGHLSWIALVFMLGSGILHTVYFWLLSLGYRVGDLSIVYPIARATGPLLATIFAIVVFGENPTLIVFGGTIVISLGVLILTGNPQSLLQSTILPAVIYGILTGIAVTTYTLWDAYAMNQAAIPPLFFQGGISFIRMLILLPYALTKTQDVRNTWQVDKWYIVGIAIMSSSSYLIILFVLAFLPVSYVAPMRTLSILFGVIIGTNLLKEEDMWQRILGSIIIVVGVIMLNVG